jgi:DMSO/TMAO reductase YedYZ molybdopterin-dependent catalytic subunit
MTRRFFLKALAGLAFLLGLPSTAWSFFVDRLLTRTVEKTHFRFDHKTGLVIFEPGSRQSPYTLRLEGLVKKPASLSYRELQDLPRVKQTSDFHCVEGWSVKDLEWSGFQFADLMKHVELKPEARYAVFQALGETESQPKGLKHYREVFPIAELMNPEKEIILALALAGRPLSHEHGAPLRVVSPYDLGYKSIKYVTRIEFTARPEPGWWTVANPIYRMIAPVPAERLRKR